MLRIGLLGAARIAPAAIIEPAAAHGIADAHGDYRALIDRDDIDLVYNALPPSGHMPWSVAALGAGKHVLCEKPFAMNAAEAERMVDAARQTGRHLIEAFHYRFHPLFARVLDIVHAGAIGPLRHIEAVFDVQVTRRPGALRFDPALGGGGLMDLGCYPVHWARTLAGEEPAVQTARARQDPLGIDVHMEATLAFPSGVTAQIACAMESDRPQTHYARLVATGTRGRLVIDNPLAPHRGHRLRLETATDAREETVAGRSTYAHQFDHVLAVLAGATAPLTGGADAIANMAAIDAIYRAAGMQPRGAA